MQIVRYIQIPRGLSGPCSGAGRVGRRAPMLEFVLVLGLASMGCGKSGIADEVNAFKGSGQTVSGFADTDPSSFGAKKCQTGTVDRLSVLLCEYASSDSAAGGQAAAETWGAETATVVVLRRGSMLFAVADRDHADPDGKTISALSKVFRRTKGR